MPQHQIIGRETELTGRAHPVRIYQDGAGITYTLTVPDGSADLKVRLTDSGAIRVTLPPGPWVSDGAYLDYGNDNFLTFWPRPPELVGS
jgi:hypothetical protein